MEFKLTTDEELAAMAPGSRTIVIIGMVHSIESIVEVGQARKLKLFKFTLSNNETSIISCACWGLDIPHIQLEIKLNDIILLKNAWSSKVDTKWNRGNCGFELTFKKSSTIKVLLERILESVEQEEQPVEILFKDVANFESKKVCMKAWIKSSFVQLTNMNPYSTYGCGSIMSSKYCLEIHIAQFNPTSKFPEESHVSVTGFVEPPNATRNITLKVLNMANIRLDESEANISEFATMNAVMTPKRKRDDEFDQDFGKVTSR